MILKILTVCLFLGVADCISHCEIANIEPEYWKNEGVAVIYVMKSSLQNWQAHVSTLVHLQSSLRNIDVNVNLVIATNRNCSAFQSVRDFKIETSAIWETLDHHDDYPEAYVIDRCGKITYHIIFPWSLVKWFPFVKGAILSTFFDKPCGPCEFNLYPVSQPNDLTEVEKIKVYPKMTTVTNKKITDDTAPPVEIIIREKHRHEGSNEIFEYTEMELGNSHYHRHFHNLEEMEFIPFEQNFDKTENVIMLDGNDKREDTQNHFKHTTYRKKAKRVVTKSEEQSIFSMNESKPTNIDEKLREIATMCSDQKDMEQSDSKYYGKLFQNLLKAVYSSDEKVSSSEIEQKEKITHHYEKLNNWISYII